MKVLTSNIERGTILLDLIQMRLGLVTEIYTPTPMMSIGVVFMGSGTTEVLYENDLTCPNSYRLVPTYEIYP